MKTYYEYHLTIHGTTSVFTNDMDALGKVMRTYNHSMSYGIEVGDVTLKAIEMNEDGTPTGKVQTMNKFYNYI